MRVIASLLLALCLTGCTQLIEVHSNRGEVDLDTFRSALLDINRDLTEWEIVSEATLSMDGDQAVVTYVPDRRFSAKAVRSVILDFYLDRRQDSPFAIESIEIVSNRSRGVQVNSNIDTN